MEKVEASISTEGAVQEAVTTEEEPKGLMAKEQ